MTTEQPSSTSAAHSAPHWADDCAFFVSRQTRRKLENEKLAKVVLVGGFCGAWNFGDLLQLRAMIDWHRARDGKQVLCPLHVFKYGAGPEYKDKLLQAFGTEDWLYHNPDGAWAHQAIAAFGLVPLREGIRGPVTLHVYGGGFFNRFWGQDNLERIEAVLEETVPRHYIMSGQQVGPEFAGALAQHCQCYRPEIIGCRDQGSVDILRDQGLDALLSGDDALDMLEAAIGDTPPADPSNQNEQDAPATFALCLNSSDYVFAGDETWEAAPGPAVLYKQLDASIRLLGQTLGAQAVPAVIAAYPDERPEIRDTPATVKDACFAQIFPQHTTVDLVDAFVRRRLDDAAAALRRCRLALSTSYHVTLFLELLGIPVYLFAFNDYFRQKRQGLGQTAPTLEEFLAATQQYAEQQRQTLEQRRAVRVGWLAAMSAVLDAAPRDGVLLARATATLGRLHRARQPYDARVQAAIAAEQARVLASQLQTLKASLSWRLTAPLRRLAQAARWRPAKIQ
jgi:hypothetical protein